MPAFALPRNTDPCAPPPPVASIPSDRPWTSGLADPREVISTRPATRRIVPDLPLAVGISLLPARAVAVVVVPCTVVLFVAFGGPKMFGPHAVAHRPLFRVRCDHRSSIDIVDGLGDNQTVFWKLMRKDHGALVDHLRDPGGRRPSREERTVFLQARARGRTGALEGIRSAARTPERADA